MIKKFLCKSFWDVLTFQSLYFEMIERLEQTLGGWKTVVDKSNFFSAHTFVKIWSQMIFESDSLINKRWHFSCKKMYKYIGWVFFLILNKFIFILKRWPLDAFQKNMILFLFFLHSFYTFTPFLSILIPVLHMHIYINIYTNRLNMYACHMQ